MNTYGLLGGLLIMAGLGSWAVWERGSAESWQNKYLTLQSSYAQTAQKAKDDAAAQIAADKAENQRRADSSIAQAEAGKKLAQDTLQSYLARGNAASRGKVDLPHACFSVQVPSELLPVQK